MGRPGRLNLRTGTAYNRQLSLENFEAERIAEELSKGSRRTYAVASIALMAPNEHFIRYISKRNDIDPNGYLDVIVHGSSKKVQIQHNGSLILINHRELAKIIKAKKGSNLIGVRLLSCNTGSKSDGFAQRLADKLHVPVIAPTKYEFAWPSGRHGPYAGIKDERGEMIPDLSQSGEYKTFYPRRIKK